MRVNPFYDFWLFLIGEDAFHLGIGPWRYLLVAIYWALAIASVYLAYRNWQADPAQRTKAHLGTWLACAYWDHVVRGLPLEAPHSLGRF